MLTGPKTEAATFAVIFGLIWAAIAALMVWLLRLPVAGHVLSLTAPDILRAVALSWALVLVLPLAGSISKDPVRAAAACQMGFWSLLAALWLLGPVLPVAVDVIAASIILAGFWQLMRRGNLQLQPTLVIGLAASVMALLHIFTLLDMGYGQPLATEAALMGKQHRDTLFHASIAGFLSEYGVPSTGYDGVTPLSYHVLSHRLLAAFSDWIGASTLNAYTLFLPILGAPLLMTHLFWTYALIASGPRKTKTTASGFFELTTWVLFFSVLAFNSFWVSESYIVSLWALLGAIGIMGSGNRLGKTNWLFVAGALALLVSIATLAKISTGAVLACGVTTYVSAAGGYRLRAFVLGALSGLLTFYAVQLLAPVTSGYANQSFIAPFATLFLWPQTTVFHILLVLVLLAATQQYLHRNHSTPPILIAVWVIMLAGIGAALLVNFASGSALYFINPVLWAGLCLLSLMGLDLVRKGLGMSVRLSMYTLMLFWIFEGQTDNIRSGLNHYQTQLAEIRTLTAGRDQSELPEALPLGRVVLAANSSDGVFVPPAVEGFWQLSRPCWSALLVVPAITATPMLTGLPAPDSGCRASRFYGFSKYSRDVSTQRALDDQAICEIAATRDIQIVSIVQADLAVRRLSCTQ